MADESRLIIPHAPSAVISPVVLFTGEVAVDETLGAVRIGDGATPGGLEFRRGWVEPRVPDGDDGTIDRTGALLAAIATGLNVRIRAGLTLMVSDWLDMLDNQTIWVESGARINQVTSDKGIFRATSKTRPMVVNDGILHGPGVWLNTWTGNGAHQERGVMFRGCTDGVLDGSGTIRNFGHAQFAVLGGSFRGQHRLEGTHEHGTPIGSGDNFQMGLYVTDDDTYGPLVCGYFKGRISGVTQGALRENRESGAPSLINAGPLELDLVLTKIPGQHGVYIQRGNLKATLVAKDIELSVCKVSTAGIANAAWSNVECDVVCEDVGGNMFEVESLTTTGFNQNLILNGVGNNIRGAGLSLLNGVKNLRANIEVEDSVLGFQAQGVNQTDVDVTINGRKIGQSGVAIYSTNSNFRVRPVLRECNDDNTATDCGILVQSASATVDLYDPVATDSNTRQKYALFNSTLGSVVRVHGRAEFSGGALGDIRATGVIAQWPTETVLDIDRTTSPQNVYSPLAMRTKVRSTSGSSVVLWQRTMPDESAFSVRATITGKLENSSQRAVYVVQALFFRDAGGVCTQQGTTQVITSVVSGSFAGAYALQSNGGNDIVILVNSGGTANYDWTARVEVETLPA